MADFRALNGKTVVFIGGGNMAGAMIEGLLCTKKTHDLTLNIGVSEKCPDKQEVFAKKGLMTTTPEMAHTLINQADVVVLAVKPQMLHEVAPSLAPHLADKLVLSVLAGVPSAVLSNTLACNQVVRAMPNLPAAIGQGATGLYADEGVNQASQDVCTAIMSSCGLVAWVHDEAHLHAVTAVAGSAPAYFFYVLEHMIAQATAMGLSAEDAHRLAVQSMVGAGELARNGDPHTLRENVTSKGGTTAEALASLQDDDVGNAFRRAMMACYERSVTLGQLFD